MGTFARLMTALFLVSALSSATAGPTAPRAKIDSGIIEGVASSTGDALVAFKGIPYAASPAGEWRWKPPRRVAPWTGVRAVRELGPVCPQTD
ncbi:MAG: carboxylesterase family protein, partial [Vicinamibacteraceae bacterium]